MEPGHNLEWTLGVDLELRSLSVEVSVSHAECIDVTAITVSGGNEAIAVLAAALLVTRAHMKSLNGGRVGCECGGNLVCLPQIRSPRQRIGVQRHALLLINAFLLTIGVPAAFTESKWHAGQLRKRQGLQFPRRAS